MITYQKLFIPNNLSVVIPTLKTSRNSHARCPRGRISPEIGHILVRDSTGDLHELRDELIRVSERSEDTHVSARTTGSISTSIPISTAVTESGASEDVLLTYIVPLEPSKGFEEGGITNVARGPVGVALRGSCCASTEEGELIVGCTTLHQHVVDPNLNII